MVKQLVCEGSCNPGLAFLDAEIRVVPLESVGMRMIDGQEVVTSTKPLTPRQIDRLRGLRHTEHVSAGVRYSESGHAKELWACDVCGHPRVYGAMH